MNELKTIGSPTYDHINVGDSIVVTEELKRQLTVYQNAPEEANLQNITERMAQAAVVVQALNVAAKNSPLDIPDFLRNPEIIAAERDATRYRWLRTRDLDTIHKGGVFAGLMPDKVVLNGHDLDKAIDRAIQKAEKSVDEFELK